MNDLPHFICLGAHKSGTSWLFNCLYEHPEIYLREKLEFFYNDKKRALGKSWYLDHFNTKSASKKIVGEFSPVYFFSKKSAQQIFEYNPEMKLIVILRNPIDRSYANYLQDVKLGHISTSISFKEALTKYPNMKTWGNYKAHLENYKALFKEEKLKILLFDDIKKDSRQILKDIFNFLEIDSQFVPKTINKKINTARIPRYMKPDAYLRNFSRYLKRSVIGEALWWKLRHSWALKYYYRLNSTGDRELKLTNEALRMELQEYYFEDINYVKNLLKRDDLNWR